MADLDVLYDKKDLSQILKRIPQLIELQMNYEKVKYLTHLSVEEE
jgi:hypothetical protein